MRRMNSVSNPTRKEMPAADAALTINTKEMRPMYSLFDALQKCAGTQRGAETRFSGARGGKPAWNGELFLEKAKDGCGVLECNGSCKRSRS